MTTDTRQHNECGPVWFEIVTEPRANGYNHALQKTGNKIKSSQDYLKKWLK